MYLPGPSRSRALTMFISSRMAPSATRTGSWAPRSSRSWCASRSPLPVVHKPRHCDAVVYSLALDIAMLGYDLKGGMSSLHWCKMPVHCQPVRDFLRRAMVDCYCDSESSWTSPPWLQLDFIRSRSINFFWGGYWDTLAWFSLYETDYEKIINIEVSSHLQLHWTTKSTIKDWQEKQISFGAMIRQ